MTANNFKKAADDSLIRGTAMVQAALDEAKTSIIAAIIFHRSIDMLRGFLAIPECVEFFHAKPPGSSHTRAEQAVAQGVTHYAALRTNTPEGRAAKAHGAAIIRLIETSIAERKAPAPVTPGDTATVNDGRGIQSVPVVR